MQALGARVADRHARGPMRLRPASGCRRAGEAVAARGYRRGLRRRMRSAMRASPALAAASAGGKVVGRGAGLRRPGVLHAGRRSVPGASRCAGRWPPLSPRPGLRCRVCRPGRAGQQRECPEVGEVAGRRCRHSGAERGGGAVRVRGDRGSCPGGRSVRGRPGGGWLSWSSRVAAAGGRASGPCPGRSPCGTGRDAGRPPASRAAGRHSCRASSPDDLAAFGAEVLQQTPVGGAGEDDGQVPRLEPGAAERLLDGRPVAGKAFGAVARCRGEDQPAVEATCTSCLAFRGGDDGRVALVPGAHAELGGLGAGEPGHPGEGAAVRLRDPGQQDDGDVRPAGSVRGEPGLARRSSRAAGCSRQESRRRNPGRDSPGIGIRLLGSGRGAGIAGQPAVSRRRGCPGRRIRCSAACAFSGPAGRAPGGCRGSRLRRGRGRAGRRG